MPSVAEKGLIIPGTPQGSLEENGGSKNIAGRCLKGIYDSKGKIALGILAIGSIVLGILAKLDKLGVKLPNGFSQDAALVTSFAPLGIIALGYCSKRATKKCIKVVLPFYSIDS